MSYRCAKPEAAICASAANAPFVRSANRRVSGTEARFGTRMLGIGTGIPSRGLPAGFRKPVGLSRFRMAVDSEHCRTRMFFQRRTPRPHEACAPALLRSGREKVPGDQGVGHRPHRPDFRWSVYPENFNFWTPTDQPDGTFAGHPTRPHRLQQFRLSTSGGICDPPPGSSSDARNASPLSFGCGHARREHP